jgi:putative SOS response-associated peptidase YedK
MCGRFSLDRSADIIEARFKAKLRLQTAVLPLYNIGPGMESIAITMDNPTEISLLSWGLAEQSKDGKARNLINARTETFTQKWPFKSLVRKNRCLIPATGYIEWKLIGQRKIPFLIKAPSNELFAFAGLFEEYSGKQRFTILTKPAGPVSSQIHDRMPVILNPAMETTWLSSSSDPEELGKHFLEEEEPALVSQSISPEINSCFDNKPELLRPCAYAVPEQLKLF